MSIMYVGFDETSGEILVVTGYPQDKNLKYIDVDYYDVALIMKGIESTSKYKVEYNLKENCYKFQPRLDFEQNDLDINELVYEIPKNNEATNEDIIVIQDIENTCWKILISENLRNDLLSKNQFLRVNLSFSITAKSNPNILYKMFAVNFKQLVSQRYFIIPFTEQFEFSGESVSLFTNKKFNSYIYQVKNNE